MVSNYRLRKVMTKYLGPATEQFFTFKLRKAGLCEKDDYECHEMESIRAAFTDGLDLIIGADNLAKLQAELAALES